jgi:hypothetical protein
MNPMPSSIMSRFVRLMASAENESQHILDKVLVNAVPGQVGTGTSNSGYETDGIQSLGYTSGQLPKSV